MSIHSVEFKKFKGFINELEIKPYTIHIQQTCLKPSLDFIITDYESIRRDGDSGNGGGCVSFIKQNNQ